MQEYKSFEELKEELGEEYDKIMYDMNLEIIKQKVIAISNIELLQELIYQQPTDNPTDDMWLLNKLDGIKNILQGDKE